MGLDFRILGSIEAVGENGPIRLGGRKQRAVLAILLLNANRVVPVEKLADDLYDGAAPATAVAQVRDHVSQLRKLLASATDSIIETRSPGYLIQVEPDRLDAVRFESMVEQASQELQRGESEPAAL